MKWDRDALRGFTSNTRDDCTIFCERLNDSLPRLIGSHVDIADVDLSQLWNDFKAAVLDAAPCSLRHANARPPSSHLKPDTWSVIEERWRVLRECNIRFWGNWGLSGGQMERLRAVVHAWRMRVMLRVLESARARLLRRDKRDKIEARLRPLLTIRDVSARVRHSYRMINTLCGRRSTVFGGKNAMRLTAGGPFVAGEEELRRLWIEWVVKLFVGTAVPNAVNVHGIDVIMRAPRIAPHFENIKEELVRGISADNIERWIRRLKYRKACKRDDVPEEVLLAGGRPVAIFLSKLFKGILAQFHLPPDMRDPTLLALWKGAAKGPPTLTKAFRPVGILQHTTHLLH